MKIDRRLAATMMLPMLLVLVAGCGSAEKPVMTTAATEPPPAPTDAPPPTATMVPATETPIPPTDTSLPPVAGQTWPTKRESHAMAYDPQSKRVLLFCGYDEFVGAWGWEHEDEDLKARDEWAYDVARNRLELLGLVPSVIYNQAVTNGRAGRVLAFGPENTMVYNMEKRDWEKANPALEPPTYRFWYDLAYDRQSDKVILFGGYPQLQDTWAYDHQTNTWQEMKPEVSPAKRRGHAMAYDAESDRVILWGAGEEGVTPMSEVEHATIWAYDYEADTWTPIDSSGGPSYRGQHSMVYHPGTDRIILFGGHHLGDVEFSDETWAYDYNSNTWTQLTPDPHPSGRRFHAMVYDEAADKMVLFGGVAGNWLKEEINDELWVFDPVAEEWSQVTPGSVNQ